MGFGLLFSACSCSFWLDTLRNRCGSPGERHPWVLSHRPHHVLVPAPSRHVIQFVLVSGPERRPDRSVLSLSWGKAPAVFSGCGFPPELGVSPPICWAPARWMSPEPHQGRKGSSHRGCLGRRSKTRARLLRCVLHTLRPAAGSLPGLGSASPAFSSSCFLLLLLSFAFHQRCRSRKLPRLPSRRPFPCEEASSQPSPGQRRRSVPVGRSVRTAPYLC